MLLITPIRFIDPDGMYSTEEWKKDNGITDDDLINVYTAPENEPSQQQDPQSYGFEDYVKIWEKGHGMKMSDKQREVLRSGCIGITSLELGNQRDPKTGAPKNTRAYSSLANAQRAAEELKRDLKEHPENYPEPAQSNCRP